MARRATYKLTIADVEYIAYQLAKQLMEWDEPIPPFETRFPEKLESCIATPFQTFGKKSLYQGINAKGAILFYLLIKNHPFQNGNKRIAVMTLLYFLSENGRWLRVGSRELYNFAKHVAGSDPKEKTRIVGAIEKFISKYSVLSASRHNDDEVS